MGRPVPVGRWERSRAVFPGSAEAVQGGRLCAAGGAAGPVPVLRGHVAAAQ